MKVYSLTKLGKRVASTKIDSSEEGKVLGFLSNNKTGTEDELDVIGGRYIVRKLVKEGLVKELTT